MISLSRLVTLPLIPPPQPLRWVEANPNESLDYSLDLSLVLNEVQDSIVSSSASIAPSGSGELQASNLQSIGSVVSLWLAGGIAGRDYKVTIVVATAGGRIFSQTIHLAIAQDLPQGVIPGPQHFGSGAEISSGFIPGFLFNDLRNSGYIALLTGF